MKATVITVSDRASSGEYEDRSGPIAVERLTGLGFDTTAVIVADETDSITTALLAAQSSMADVVVTTGGTGLSARDVTPEATMALVDRVVPGISERIRREGTVATAALSRGIAGCIGQMLVVNLAGSTGAVREGMTAIEPILVHAVEQLHGGAHRSPSA